VADDVLATQEALVGAPLPRAALVAALQDAFAADPDHGAMGRSAGDRLARARAQAAAHSITVPTLDEIAADTAAG
jgi:hypothetical protein